MRHGTRFVGCTILALAIVLPLTAQQGARNYNERRVEKSQNALDRSGIWMLDFVFKDPRLINVEVPGRLRRDGSSGPRPVWYLWYQVANNTGAPRTFIPRFVWVCHDENTVHEDQLLPKAQQAVQRFEDPMNLLKLKNSVTIFESPIPVSKEFNDKGERIAYPKFVSGVATWDDINPKCDRFSIFVYGLSDGWAVVDGPDGKPIYRRKTLQLKYERKGDEFSPRSDEIKYVGHEWIYAAVEPPAAELSVDPGHEEKPKPADPAGRKPAGK